MAKNPGKSLEKTDIRQSDFRPEAYGASFQTKNIAYQHAFLCTEEKDGYEI